MGATAVCTDRVGMETFVFSYLCGHYSFGLLAGGPSLSFCSLLRRRWFCMEGPHPVENNQNKVSHTEQRKTLVDRCLVVRL